MIDNEVALMTGQGQSVKGVIFDLDETIIGTLGAYAEALNTGIRMFGLEPVTEDEAARLLDEGLKLGETLLALFPSVFAEKTKQQACQQEVHKAYLGLEAQKVSLKPGVQQTLQSLKERGIKIGIVTGRLGKGERRWLELRRLGVDRFVDVMVTAADATAKPAPDGLVKCIAELGLSAEECVFVGDSKLDVMAGKEAGVRTVAISSGVAGREVLAEYEPDFILEDMSLLLPRVVGL